MTPLESHHEFLNVITSKSVKDILVIGASQAQILFGVNTETKYGKIMFQRTNAPDQPALMELDKEYSKQNFWINYLSGPTSFESDFVVTECLQF